MARAAPTELARLDWLRSIRTDILDVASYSRVRAAFNDARWGMCSGAFLAAIGIVLFAWGRQCTGADVG
jgi:hypothetical protein